MAHCMGTLRTAMQLAHRGAVQCGGAAPATHALDIMLGRRNVQAWFKLCAPACMQAIELKNCDVYSYQSDLETDPFGEKASIWSFNYFFYNKVRAWPMLQWVLADMCLPLLAPCSGLGCGYRIKCLAAAAAPTVVMAAQQEQHNSTTAYRQHSI